ncbi:MAG: TRAP transporter small permease subunit [Rhodospirillales bacterium]|nr:TRAP transporter small permease subunit [Rhodospirillales bacterium]
MRVLRSITHVIDWINEQVGRAVSWLLVFMILDVFTVVVLRYLFDVGWVWMQELYVWSHATVFMLGAAYTLLHDGHVRIDLIYRTASKRYQASVNLLGCIFLAAPLMYVILDRSWRMISRSWDVYEKSAEAGGLHGVFLLKTVIAVFCILFGLQVLSLLLKSVLTLLGEKDETEFTDPDDGETVL